jgi:hypothetical protein
MHHLMLTITRRISDHENPSTRLTCCKPPFAAQRCRCAIDRLGWDRLYRSPTAVEPIYSHDLSEEELASYQTAQGTTNDCAIYSVAAVINLLDDTKGRRAKRSLDQAASRPSGEPQIVVRGAAGKVNYKQAVAIANRHAILRKGTGLLKGLSQFVAGQDYRAWLGGPTIPRNQKHLAEELAERHGMEISADAMRGTTEDLLFLLGQRGAAVLITIGWGREDRPRILFPDGKFRPFAEPETLKIGRSCSTRWSAAM